MRVAQYTNQEKAIVAADSGGIRQRWMYGLRILNDEEKIAPGGGLRHGVADTLIKSAAKVGVTLSAREIRWRMQCARAYPTEAQIGRIITEFKSWFALIQAGFPEIEIPAGEPPADWRTQAEKDHDRAHALADLIGEQGALFPVSQFEPAEITLKDLEDYADQQDRITAGFAATCRKRRDYLADLKAAVHGDMSRTWAEAQAALDARGGTP